MIYYTLYTWCEITNINGNCGGAKTWALAVGLSTTFY